LLVIETRRGLSLDGRRKAGRAAVAMA